MDDVVRLQSNSSYATLSAALTLTKGRRVAVVFPVSERACLHNAAALTALRKRCQLLGKELVIIGGDAWLRAHAVAVGFEAATSLEDWGETAPEIRIVRLPRAVNSSPRLWLVTPDHASGRATSEHDTWVSEPPDYVVALRETYPDRSSVVRRPLIALPPEPAPLDEDEDDPITASERFEERVIGRILETSGIHRPETRGAL